MSGSRVPNQQGAAIPVGGHRRNYGAALIGTPGPTGLNDPGACDGRTYRMPLAISLDPFEMNLVAFTATSLDVRGDWYESQLTQFDDLLTRAAHSYRVPKQLIATAVLCLLIDADMAGHTPLGDTSASGPIAEVSLAHGRLDCRSPQEQFGRRIASDEVRGRNFRCADVQPRIVAPERVIAENAVAILAILQRHRESAADSIFSSAMSVSDLRRPSDIYAFVEGSSQRGKERKLASFVLDAYNLPGHPENVGGRTNDYGESTLYGQYGGFIAEDLYDLALFR